MIGKSTEGPIQPGDWDIIGPPDGQERRAYDNVEFTRLRDRGSGRIVQNIDLRHCSFSGCSLASGDDPRKRTVIRRLSASDCRISGRFGMVGAAILEETTIRNFRSGQILIFSGAAFRRVVLKGHLPSINFNEMIPFGPISPEKAERFLRANLEFYLRADWALDITEAESPGLKLSCIPGELIRRDPATQILVSKSRLIGGRWESLPLPPITRIQVERCLKDNFENQVIVAGKRSSHFAEEMRGIDILRREGIAID